MSRAKMILSMALGNTNEESVRMQDKRSINPQEIQECDILARVGNQNTITDSVYDAESHLACPAQEKQTIFPVNTQVTQVPAIVGQGRESPDRNFDTDSYPDSQPDHNISFSDDEESLKLRTQTKPIVIILPSDSSESDSDSDRNSSTSSSSSDFSSDDSVKDPNFLPEKLVKTDRHRYHLFSPQPGPSGAEDEPKNIEMEPSNTDTEPPISETELQQLSIDTEPPNIGTQLSSISTEPLTFVTQPPSIDTQPPSVDTQPPSVDTSLEPQQLSRKRKCDPASWKRNKAKALKNSGKAYITMSKSKKQMEAKTMGPVCSDKCKLKCADQFSSVERLTLFDNYWKTGDLTAQRHFISDNMTTIEPKYRYVRVGSTRQNFNHAYFFPQHGRRIRVCKVFFMNTLAISDKTIRTVVKKNSERIGLMQENRGKHGNQFQLEAALKDGVKAHINSIPRIESHYCRARTKRQFIEGNLSIATLHRLYVDKCKEENKLYVSYKIYYNIFVEDFNISFWQPKKDQCEDCTAFKNAEDKSLLQEKYDLHLIEKSLARSEKERDKQNINDDLVVCVYDLQAVMPCPQGEVSSFYYISKLNLLNFTITKLGTNSTDCFVWHEGEGGRGANEIGSCVFMYLNRLNDEASGDIDVVFYSDNCCGQQKNKFMLATYQHAVNLFPKLRSITHKFLIKGHTQNEGDAVHSLIQRNISMALKSSPIYVPDQYITLIKTAKKKGTPFVVHELTHEDFIDLKCLAVGNFVTSEDGQKVKWSDIKIIKVQREHKHQFLYKTSYQSTEFVSVSTLTKKMSKSTTNHNIVPKRLYNHKLTISETKKQGILKLIEKNIIPKYYESFYKNL